MEAWNNYPIDLSKYQIHIKSVCLFPVTELTNSNASVEDFNSSEDLSFIVCSRKTKDIVLEVDIQGLSEYEAIQELRRQIYELEGPHE